MSARILVVEDDDDLARLLSVRLRNADFTVQRAANGEVGVRLAREFDPEIILMDWMMPIKSGIQACEDIRADPWIRQPYIAMLSAKTAPDDLVRAEQAGADEYITKPFSPLHVVDRVTTILEARRDLVAQPFG
jgi:DNA-binding response OmpR family regulator